MNWFVVLAGVLYFGAAFDSLRAGSTQMMLVWLCYGFANLMLAWAELKTRGG